MLNTLDIGRYRLLALMFRLLAADYPLQVDTRPVSCAESNQVMAVLNDAQPTTDFMNLK